MTDWSSYATTVVESDHKALACLLVESLVNDGRLRCVATGRTWRYEVVHHD
jgi:hypothetical protein